MEIQSFKKKNGNIYEIKFKDNTKLSLYDDTIIKYNLLVNKKIATKTLKEILDFNQKIEAYYKALKYLSIKMRTKYEISNYLIKNNYDEKIILETIKRLEKEKYLDDTLYIKSYINDQINLSLKGPQKIRQELLKLGFKEEIFQDYLNSFSNDIWQEKIMKIITKKVKSNHNLSDKMLKEKTKQYFLKEGYFLNQILENIDNFEFTIDDNILMKEFNKECIKLSKKYRGYELQNKLKYNLYRKGFDLSSIDKLLDTIDNDEK